MSEIDRLLSKQEFEDGLATRLRIGEFVADQVVNLRMEFPSERQPGSPTHHIEIPVYLQLVSDVSDGRTIICYTQESDRRKGSERIIKDELDRQSVGQRIIAERPYRLYLSGHFMGDMDDEISLILDTE